MRRRSKSIKNSKEEIKYLLNAYYIDNYVKIYLDYRRKLKIITKLDYDMSDDDIAMYSEDLYKILSKVITNIYKLKSKERALRIGTWNYLDKLEEVLLRDFFIFSKQQHNRCGYLQFYGKYIIKLRNILYIHDFMLNTINIVPDMVSIDVEIERSWGAYLIGNEKLEKLIEVAMNDYDGDKYIQILDKDLETLNEISRGVDNYPSFITEGTIEDKWLS